MPAIVMSDRHQSGEDLLVQFERENGHQHLCLDGLDCKRINKGGVAARLQPFLSTIISI